MEYCDKRVFGGVREDLFKKVTFELSTEKSTLPRQGAPSRKNQTRKGPRVQHTGADGTQ